MAKQGMDINNSPLFTELTDEDASHINGGLLYDISGDLLNTLNSMYAQTANIYYAAGLFDLGDFWSGMYAAPIIPTDFL